MFIDVTVVEHDLERPVLVLLLNRARVPLALRAELGLDALAKLQRCARRLSLARNRASRFRPNLVLCNTRADIIRAKVHVVETIAVDLGNPAFDIVAIGLATHLDQLRFLEARRDRQPFLAERRLLVIFSLGLIGHARAPRAAFGRTRLLRRLGLWRRFVAGRDPRFLGGLGFVR